MNNILIVDFSEYRNSIAKIYRDKGFNPIICESAFDAMSKLKAYDIDLVVSEIELPGDNSFALYDYLNNNYSYIPIIMTTDKNIDLFFDKIFIEGIGNVICKPVNKEELINLSVKLITKENIFDLKNYLNDIIELKKIRINSSKQIKNAIFAMIKEIEDWGFKIQNVPILNLVLNEMIINAVYHSHGYTKEKEARRPVTLQEGKYVDLFFAKNNSGYGISINDYNGILSKEIILKSINKVIQQSQMIEEAIQKGEDISAIISETGRGIDLVRKLSGDYYFIIKKSTRTEIILIFEHGLDSDDKEYFSSLKIIEDKS